MLTNIRGCVGSEMRRRMWRTAKVRQSRTMVTLMVDQKFGHLDGGSKVYLLLDSILLLTGWDWGRLINVLLTFLRNRGLTAKQQPVSIPLFEKEDF